MNPLHPSPPDMDIDGRQIRANMWLTSHCRMRAYSRYRRYDLFSHILLTVYSLAIIYFSIVAKSGEATVLGVDPSDLIIFLSACVVVLSTLTWGLRFGELAEQHKRCYLKIEELLEEDSSTAGPSYRRLLSEFPNHSWIDMEGLVFDSWIKSKPIYDRHGAINMTFWRGLAYVTHLAVRSAVVIALLLAPIGMALFF